ncbi:hypothetical protein NHN12_02995 [Lactiplantibacillus plantarum]|uniref:hypothetical protein n=1 Tax=Lactiplantibacillus plantarum TaxID=1590 RepID=UPI00209D42ED|nr:hypothetical protein [Lactiplantibacillus plantarum]USZ61373.1 hypothetical protein NHN12_02995 [Lactiplantibacillus plantarum]
MNPNVVEAIASVSAAILSLLAIYFTIKSYVESLARINLKPASSRAICFCEPDRISVDNPDKFWNSKYRFFCDIIIENKSSRPSSIENLILDDKYELMTYDSFSADYKITLKKLVPLVQDQVIRNYSTIGNELRPVINLAPYSSVRKIAVFNIQDDDSFKNGTHMIKVLTSRKNFSFNLTVSSSLRTVLSPEEQYQPDMPRNFDDSKLTTPEPIQTSDTSSK